MRPQIPEHLIDRAARVRKMMKEGEHDRRIAVEVATEVARLFGGIPWTEEVLKDVRKSAEATKRIWPNRDLPSFTEAFWGTSVPTPEEAGELVVDAEDWQELSWEDLLFEALCRTHDSADPEALYRNLVTSAALIVEWAANVRAQYENAS